MTNTQVKQQLFQGAEPIPVLEEYTAKISPHTSEFHNMKLKFEVTPLLLYAQGLSYRVAVVVGQRGEEVAIGP